MIFLYLFYTFCKIGLFGFGGGYAMLSMIQGEVVTRYNWISASEFTDIIAISQMTPGPIGINSATYVGYTAVLNAGYNESWAIFGSCIATFAVVFPSFILMVIISRFFLKWNHGKKGHHRLNLQFAVLLPNPKFFSTIEGGMVMDTHFARIAVGCSQRRPWTLPNLLWQDINTYLLVPPAREVNQMGVQSDVMYSL